MLQCSGCHKQFLSQSGLGGHYRWSPTCRADKEGLKVVQDDEVQETFFVPDHPEVVPAPMPFDINSFECRYLREQNKLLDRKTPLNINPGPCKMFGEKKFGTPQALHYILITSFVEKYSLSNEVGTAILLLIRQLSASSIEPGEIPLPKEYRDVRDHVVKRSQDRLRTPTTVSIDLPTELYGDLSTIPKKDRTSKSPALNIITAIG